MGRNFLIVVSVGNFFIVNYMFLNIKEFIFRRSFINVLSVGKFLGGG